VRFSWLVAHIAALLAAYVALGFSLLASILYLVQERRLKSKHKPAKTPVAALDWLPPLDTLERIAHACWSSAFLRDVGLVIGSVLAQETVLARATSATQVIASFAMWASTSRCCLFAAAPDCADAGPFISPARSSCDAGRAGANVFSRVHRFGPQ